MAIDENRTLELKYSGRIIDHLGIQMYQSPVAAIAELVSNSWDADAEKVEIDLPEVIDDHAFITIKDDGNGMTFDECQNRFLNVGYCRRGSEPKAYSKNKHRPILGRKGIGKFAGFGISEIIKIETVSEETGERTVFELDINNLRSEEYVVERKEIEVIEYEEPCEQRKELHGTTVTLKHLNLIRKRNPEQFARSMSRRFLLNQRSADFEIKVNGVKIPDTDELENIEYIFPEEYRDEEKHEGLLIENGWGKERLENGKEIKWRIIFYKNPIQEEELRGIAIFANGKLAQKPFFFQLTGGLSGQHGQQYISGKIQADYTDELPEELITTDRQEINWETPESKPLLEWGKKRTKELLAIWKKRRGEKRETQLEERLSGFTRRLDSLEPYEKRSVKKALKTIGSIDTISDRQFEDLGRGFLTAWEQGRLRGVIEEISSRDSFDSSEFLSILNEVNVLTALHLKESIETKLSAITKLEEMIENRELENNLRDHIAEHPWLLNSKWETFTVERSVKTVLEAAAVEVGFTDDIYNGRIDLALRSSGELLVVEFMRPGLKLDIDHLNRCNQYVASIKGRIVAKTDFGITEEGIYGLIVADNIEKNQTNIQILKTMAKSNITANDWPGILDTAKSYWSEYLEIIKSRDPEDERLQE